MKKLVLILTLAAFACSPLLQTEVQAASKSSVQTVSSKKHKKHHKKHKKHSSKSKKST